MAVSTSPVTREWLMEEMRTRIVGGMTTPEAANEVMELLKDGGLQCQAEAWEAIGYQSLHSLFGTVQHQNRLHAESGSVSTEPRRNPRPPEPDDDTDAEPMLMLEQLVWVGGEWRTLGEMCRDDCEFVEGRYRKLAKANGLRADAMKALQQRLAYPAQKVGDFWQEDEVRALYAGLGLAKP